MRFHTIYWPIFLHALGLELPKQVFGHGWLLFGGDKMSKSKGNIEYAEPIVARYGVDALRYYLMREMPFGSDGNYTNEAMLTRTNADLANKMGNLVSRTVAMIEKYFDGVVPAPAEDTELEKALKERFEALPAIIEKNMDELQFSVALSEIWKLVEDCNGYIDQTQPWVLGKDESQKARLGTVMYYLAECVRAVAVAIGPTMPNTPERIFAQLGVTDESLKTWESIQKFGGLKPGTKVCKGEALFPRYDVAKELAAIAAEKGEAPAEPEKKEKKEKKQEQKAEKKAEKKEEKKAELPEGMIGIEDFLKVKLIAAKVIACEKVEGSDKLLKETLDVGNGATRTVLSGIAKHYSPEEMVGKSVVLVANLMPRKMKGIMSEGMLLCAENADGSLKLLSSEGAEPGAEIG